MNKQHAERKIPPLTFMVKDAMAMNTATFDRDGIEVSFSLLLTFKRRRIAYADIHSVELERTLYNGVANETLFLLARPDNSGIPSQKIALALGGFNKKNRLLLFNALAHYAPQAQFDELAQKFLSSKSGALS